MKSWDDKPPRRKVGNFELWFQSTANIVKIRHTTPADGAFYPEEVIEEWWLDYSDISDLAELIDDL